MNESITRNKNLKFRAEAEIKQAPFLNMNTQQQNLSVGVKTQVLLLKIFHTACVPPEDFSAVLSSDCCCRVTW